MSACPAVLGGEVLPSIGARRPVAGGLISTAGWIMPSILPLSLPWWWAEWLWCCIWCCKVVFFKAIHSLVNEAYARILAGVCLWPVCDLSAVGPGWVGQSTPGASD